MPKSKKIAFPKITFVNADTGDWEGIYVDGVLLREDHSLAPDDVLSVLGIEYTEHWVDMEDGSRLPRSLADLKDRIKD